MRGLSRRVAQLPAVSAVAAADDALPDVNVLAAFTQAAQAELVTMDRGFRTHYPALRVIVLS